MLYVLILSPRGPTAQFSSPKVQGGLSARQGAIAACWAPMVACPLPHSLLSRPSNEEAAPVPDPLHKNRARDTSRWALFTCPKHSSYVGLLCDFLEGGGCRERPLPVQPRRTRCIKGETQEEAELPFQPPGMQKKTTHNKTCRKKYACRLHLVRNVPSSIRG